MYIKERLVNFFICCEGQKCLIETVPFYKSYTDRTLRLTKPTTSDVHSNDDLRSPPVLNTKPVSRPSGPYTQTSPTEDRPIHPRPDLKPRCPRPGLKHRLSRTPNAHPDLGPMYSDPDHGRRYPLLDHRPCTLEQTSEPDTPTRIYDLGTHGRTESLSGSGLRYPRSDLEPR